MVLSNWGISTSDTEMIGLMNTSSVSGTYSVEQVAKALNKKIGTNFYRTVYIYGSTATATQKATLKSDLVEDVGRLHRGFVANVLGHTTDTLTHPHNYPGGHYVAVMGYSQSGAFAWVADPWDGAYWLSTSNLADWIAEKGYTI